eukprot:GEMP01006985.1.p1 GENE.GEMP01006985.1~~GEMP01006985.1.p1  ORF type:complete len:1001 (+),score=226.91 GEMP01006985.1:194-3196(+)
MFVNRTAVGTTEATRRRSAETYAEFQLHRRNLIPTMPVSPSGQQQHPDIGGDPSRREFAGQPWFWTKMGPRMVVQWVQSRPSNRRNSGWCSAVCPWSPVPIESRVSFDNSSVFYPNIPNGPSSETPRSISMPPPSRRVESPQSLTQRSSVPQDSEPPKAFSVPHPQYTPTMHPQQMPPIDVVSDPATRSLADPRVGDGAAQKDTVDSQSRTPVPAISPRAPPQFHSYMPEGNASFATAPLWRPQARFSLPERNMTQLFGDRGQYPLLSPRLSSPLGASFDAPCLFNQPVLTTSLPRGTTTIVNPSPESMPLTQPDPGSLIADTTLQNGSPSIMKPARLSVPFTRPAPVPLVGSPTLQRRSSDRVDPPAASVPITRAAAMPLRTMALTVPPGIVEVKPPVKGGFQRPTAVGARPAAVGTRPTAVGEDNHWSSMSQSPGRDSIRGLQRVSYAEIDGRLPSFATIVPDYDISRGESHVFSDLSPLMVSRLSEVPVFFSDDAGLLHPTTSVGSPKLTTARATEDVAATEPRIFPPLSDVTDADTLPALSQSLDDDSDVLLASSHNCAEKPNAVNTGAATKQAVCEGATASNLLTVEPRHETSCLVDADGRVSPYFGLPASKEKKEASRRVEESPEPELEHKLGCRSFFNRVLLESHHDRRSFFDRVDMVQKGLNGPNPHAYSSSSATQSITISVRTDSPANSLSPIGRRKMRITDNIHPAKTRQAGAFGSAPMTRSEYTASSNRWESFMAALTEKDALMANNADIDDDGGGAREDGTDTWALMKRVQWIVDIINRNAIERVARYSMLRTAMCVESERVCGFQDALEQLTLDAGEALKILRKEKGEAKIAINELRMNMFGAFSENQIESRRAFQSLASDTANVVSHATVVFGTRDHDFDAARSMMQREMRKEMLVESAERQGICIAGNSLGFAIERECMSRTKVDAKVQHKINGLVDALESFKTQMADMEKKVAIQMQFEESAETELLKELHAQVAKLRSIHARS